MADRVFVREVGCREGFQNLRDVRPTEQKLGLVRLLARTGLRRIEVTSFVRPDTVPQHADAEAVAAGLPPSDGSVEFTALYLNRTGFERALATGRLHVDGRIHGSADTAFLRRNYGHDPATWRAALPAWREAFVSKGVALAGLVVSAAFGTRDAASDPEAVAAEVAEAERVTGVPFPEVCLADTAGTATPRLVRRLIEAVGSVSRARVALHVHDSVGSGVACCVAGLDAGVRTFDTSISGLGGCPFSPGAAGNVCTEDFVFLCEKEGLETGVDLDRLFRASAYVRDVIGVTPESKSFRLFGS